MCEVNGVLYYVSGSNDKQKIMRVEQDGSSPAAVTDEHPYISQMTTDGTNLFFVSAVDHYYDSKGTIYKLPLQGGAEVTVVQGNIHDLQYAKGKLYWYDDGQTVNCINEDGSNAKRLYSSGTQWLRLLIGDDTIYCAASTTDSCDIYQMELDGKHIIKLNTGNVEKVDKLFYDRDQLYLLAEQPDGADPKVHSVETALQILDGKGTAVTLMKNVPYFPQDWGVMRYCGLSNGIFYYVYGDVNLDLHEIDLNSNRDTVIFSGGDMRDFGTLVSVRGKKMKNVDGVRGLYILGNDIYFSMYNLYPNH